MVSIIIPCFNSANYIKETIGSVLAQTYQHFEILLINDGSTDNSSSIIKTIIDDRIHLVEQENQGVSSTRNKGIAMAKGEFIVFLDADDLLHPNFLERRVFRLSKSSAIASASNVVLVDGKGNKIEEDKKHFAANKSSQILDFKDEIVTCPSSYLFKTEFIKKHKITFNKNLQSSADKYFLLEVLKQGEIELISESPMYYRVLNESMSHKITKTLLKDQIAFYYEIKKKFYNNRVPNSYYGRLSFTIAASAYFSKEYFIFIKYLCKSFLLSPKTMISLLIK
ncbi:glycosyltransferase family 2 protein [Flavobacteriales bacterium]|nr:glycosyltransferase family 2 protein [Flavobacteriales bacterium]